MYRSVAAGYYMALSKRSRKPMIGRFITRFFYKNKAQIWPKHKNNVRIIQAVIVVSVLPFCNDNRVCFPYDRDKSSMFESCLQALFV